MTKPLACHHGRAEKLPDFLYLGTTDGEWPTQCFTNEVHASNWLNEDPRKRHVYKLDIQYVAEMRYVPPVEATFREVEL